jgi:pyruvate formate lyase activating enzyme
MNAIQGIKGFLGTSLIDYPGKVAAVVFLSGCNLRCGFCHNSVLVSAGADLEDVALRELIDGLRRRRKLLEGVVVSGGEPTVNPHLPWLLRELKSTGLEVKLDTNGLRPEVLAELLASRLVDYAAVDMKLAPARYAAQLGAPADAPELLAATVDLLRRSRIAYEYRTTCVPGMVGESDIETIARVIQGAPAYYLQQFIPTHVEDPQLAARPAYPREVLERFVSVAQRYVANVSIRNI